MLAHGDDGSFGRGLECVESLRRVAEDVHGGVVEACGYGPPEERPDVLSEELPRFFGKAGA
ncbi:hypothetical protein [Methylobacterium nonmethylotrophicum]|uniref:Uncharacterized protein n=1 Tax=Methylobacterium nonmethylotrophicum TaxID=1141884 RepID=A0A4Z0NJG1_9HYPH|nr:hypothetical protein [Methylobacterium nonmethylotrophicum]TGD96458.1 hypothetical protein EU555_23675 [Methylobacterium nonmethylotrophicum]